MTNDYNDHDFGFAGLDYEGEDPRTVRIARAVREWMVRRIGRGECLSAGGCRTFQSPLGSHGTSDSGGLLHIHYDGGDMWDYLSCDSPYSHNYRYGPDGLERVLEEFDCYIEDYSGWASIVYEH